MIGNTSGSQLKAHVFQQPTRPVPRHPSTSDTSQAPSRSDAEPALKKQKLDHTTCSSRGSTLQSHKLQSFSPGQEDRITPSPSSAKLSSSRVGSPITCPSPLSLTSPLFPARLSSSPAQVRKRYLGAPSQQERSRAAVAQTKALIPDLPTRAPSFPPGLRPRRSLESKTSQSALLTDLEHAADFLPWRGNHTEDVLSESSTKQGFYDKVQISQTESSTGRPHIWGSLRHKPGLQVLSSLLIAALDHRQAHGTITAGCTFKPPPRVTLTDSKREAWLRDLANPNIPLRRLSRTIPHGIRGRALLDQSFAKNIPTARALWLSKCVGANEIRAFKRKGTGGAFVAGGETKWIRDWTANVEQFLDAIFELCGMPEWNKRMTYGLQLAGHLLAENLLDREHYLDWLLNAVGHSDPEKLSIYLLLISSHIEDISRSRLFGRRLVDLLLAQLHTIKSKPSPDLRGRVVGEIEALLRFLISSSPTSFLLPQKWQTYEPLLQAMTNFSGPVISARLKLISMRNIRMRTLSMPYDKSDPITDQTVIKILDTVPHSSDIAELALDLWEAMHDPDCLVRICLQWSSSVFRSGQRRIYIAARLLRKWHGIGVDVETSILNFISSESNTFGLEPSSLYRTIAELARTRHFSLGRYLQWVITTGVLGKYDRSQKIPLDGVPPHLLNLRRNLLRSIGISVEDEDRTITATRERIDRTLLFAYMASEPIPNVDQSPLINHHDTWVVKSNIAHWIGQRLLTGQVPPQMVMKQTSRKSTSMAGSQAECCVDIVQLKNLFGILEDTQDFVAMAEALRIFARSHDTQVLAAVTNIVNHYGDVFAAIGVVDALFTRIFQQYLNSDDQTGITPLLEALKDLAEILPNHSSEAQTLRRRLQHSEPKLGYSAYSPISEHMAEAIHAESPSSTNIDNIEQVLASGTSMDKPLLTNVFDLIWKRFQASWTDSMQTSFASAGLITRLCSLDTAAVYERIDGRMRQILKSDMRPRLLRIWVPLVCARTTSLEWLYGRVLLMLPAVDRSSLHDELLVESMESLSANQRKGDSSIEYLYHRFHAQQQRMISNPPRHVLILLEKLLERVHASQHEASADASELQRVRKLQLILRLISDSKTQGWHGIREVFRCKTMLEETEQCLDKFVFPEAFDQKYGDRYPKLPVLLRHVNYFNLPLYQLYLHAIFMNKSKSLEEAAQSVVAAMLEVIPFTGTAALHLWTCMIRNAAEIEFFALLNCPPESTGEDLLKRLESLLSCIGQGGHHEHSISSATRILTQSHDMILRLWDIQCREEDDHGTGVALCKIDPEKTISHIKLTALLRLIHIHQSLIYRTNVSEIAVTQLLILLGRLVLHSFPTTYTHLSDEIFDLLVVVIGSTPASIQSRCRRIFHDQYHFNDSRLQYIFGSGGSGGDTWLQLATGSGPTERSAQQDYPIRKWEAMPDATPLMTENDTSISLTLFGARKKVL
ncbi:MAG: hypothetical protein Q9194_001513 [Teloschistes cf. exilis]